MPESKKHFLESLYEVRDSHQRLTTEGLAATGRVTFYTMDIYQGLFVPNFETFFVQHTTKSILTHALKADYAFQAIHRKLLDQPVVQEIALQSRQSKAASTIGKETTKH
ncbi:unnamed protein product [Adineta ricciae]|uniref:Uncharacterized protein n=1 Tax=Adineta ricciae TaxID=249248 RepID=A0A815ZC55_ADIRI|nr:unnamed protein product [Adineta ricciae]